MPRRQRKFGCDQVPTASFADIAFLMIIFFILSMAMIQTMGFETEMPAGRKSEEEPEKTPTVQIHEGKVRLADEVVSVEELRADLAAMKLREKQGNERIVMLEATGRVDYETYFQVMAAINAAGGEIVIVRESEE